MRLTYNHQIDVNEDGQIVIRVTVPDAREHGLEMRFDALLLTRAQSAQLAETVIKMQAGSAR